jgi:hypothetical protein
VGVHQPIHPSHIHPSSFELLLRIKVDLPMGGGPPLEQAHAHITWAPFVLSLAANLVPQPLTKVSGAWTTTN